VLIPQVKWSGREADYSLWLMPELLMSAPTIPYACLFSWHAQGQFYLYTAFHTAVLQQVLMRHKNNEKLSAFNTDVFTANCIQTLN
jgi:hypothetical protein